MKQLLFYLLVVFLAIHPLASFACETQKKAIPEVLQYIQKVNTDLAYIAAVTHANKCGSIGNDLVSGLESGFDGGRESILGNQGFIISSSFALTLLQMGTPPSFVLRESRMLEKYTTTIQAALQQAAQQCATDLSVTTDTFGNGTVNEVLSRIYENHIRVLNAYKQSVIGKNLGTPAPNYGVPENFLNLLQKNYGPDAQIYCQKTEGGFEVLQQKFAKIMTNGLAIEGSTQTWKDAYTLLQGATPGQAAKEQKILQKELSRQGISPSGQDAIVATLKKYPSTGNGVENFISSLGLRLDSVAQYANKQVENVIADVRQSVPEKKEGSVDTTNRLITQALALEEVQGAIQEDIIGRYITQRAKIGDAAIEVDASLGALIEAHIRLQRSIVSLQRSTKLAEKICNMQAVGQGNCHY